MRYASVIAIALFIALPAIADEPAIAPSGNLVTEGVPHIPAALAASVDRYTQFRQARFTSWHPSRREMIIATRFGDTNQAHQVKFPGGARTQLTFFPENVFGGQYQPQSGDSFIFGRDRGGDEFFQIYRYDLSSGEIARLTDGKSRNTGAVWSHSGDRVAYGSTRRTGKDVDLWLVNPIDPKSDRLLTKLEGGGWRAADWAPDNSSMLVSEGISANESYLWICDAATGEKTLLSPKGGKEQVSYGEARFSKDGKGIYVTTDLGSEFHRLAYIDLSTKKPTFLTSKIPWDVDDFALSPDGKTIAFTTNEAGLCAFHLLDTASGQEKPVPQLPVGQISGLEWHQHIPEIGFTLTTAHSPPDAYSLNVQTDKLERWTESETVGLNTTGFADPELVRWKSFDGREISGILYKPPKNFAGKRPVVIDIHGGLPGAAFGVGHRR